MKKQKIIKVGNSLAVTIPSEFIKDAKIKAGDLMRIEISNSFKTLYMTPEKYAEVSKLTPEFFHWLQVTMKENHELLKRLANVD